MTRIRSAAVLCILLSATANAKDAQGGISDVTADPCLPCCTAGEFCPPTCPNTSCPAPVTGQCPFVDLTSLACSGNDQNACRSDSDCTTEGDRCCNAGCFRACRPVCPSACDENQRCIQEVVPCEEAPCPEPQPTCVTINRPGTCPEYDPSATADCRPMVEQEKCEDTGCSGTKKCCRNACGVSCAQPCSPECGPESKCVLKESADPCTGGDCPPTPECVLRHPCSVVSCDPGFHCVEEDHKGRCEEIPEPKDGSCPINDLPLRGFCPSDILDACSRDDQCQGNNKCCKYGCSHNCVQACLPKCTTGQQCVLQRPCSGDNCAKCE